MIGSPVSDDRSAVWYDGGGGAASAPPKFNPCKSLATLLPSAKGLLLADGRFELREAVVAWLDAELALNSGCSMTHISCVRNRYIPVSVPFAVVKREAARAPRCGGGADQGGSAVQCMVIGLVRQ